MKFLWTTLQVKNLDESIGFYRDLLGLKLNGRYPGGPHMEIAFLGEGDTQVELICSENSNQNFDVKGITLGFQVDSIEKTMETIRSKGIIITKDLIQPNPHVKFFFVKDPDGFEIQFVEKI